jgi:hypothetical protein
MNMPAPIESPYFHNPWKLFRNASGEDIPPFSILRITGAENFQGAIRFIVGKPNATQQTAYLVNGPETVRATKDGRCTTLTQADYLAYDTADGSPSVGDSYGAQNGQWTAKKDVPGFFICGGVKFTAGVNAVAAIQISSADTVDTVQVFHSLGSQGKVVQPNASNFHPGRVKTWNGTELETGADIWIRFVDNNDIDLGYVYSFDGETYGPARLTGTHTIGGDTRPLYTVSINAQTFLGINREDWDQGTKVDVDIYAYVLAEEKWKKCFTTANCVDWYMNEDETIPKNTKLEITRYGQVFVVTNMYCSATDLPEFLPSPVTGTPGEMEAGLGEPSSPGDTFIFESPNTIDSIIFG